MKLPKPLNPLKGDFDAKVNEVAQAPKSPKGDLGVFGLLKLLYLKLTQ
jgi:hypothetical protein